MNKKEKVKVGLVSGYMLSYESFVEVCATWHVDLLSSTSSCYQTSCVWRHMWGDISQC